MQPEMGEVVQELTDRTGREVNAAEIWEAFRSEYLEADQPIRFLDYAISSDPQDSSRMNGRLTVEIEGRETELTGSGNGPIDALKGALGEAGWGDFKLTHYSEHALGQGTDSTAIAYIQVVRDDGTQRFGAGTHPNIAKASALALISALNRTVSAGARHPAPKEAALPVT